MKNKKKILFAILALAIMQLLPGCMIVGSRDRFAYIKSEKVRFGEFIPYIHIQKNTRRLPILLLRVEFDRLPHSLVMLQYDATYLDRDEGFRTFVVDQLQLRFSDGTVVDCIDEDIALDRRMFTVSDKAAFEFDEQMFKGVIQKRMDFSVRIQGAAIKENGDYVPFERTTKYEYRGKDWTFHTIFDEWASI